MRDLFTVVIQGPLNQTALNSIKEYSKKAHIIISCWDSDNLKLLDKIEKKLVDDIVVNKMFPRWRPSERGYYRYQTHTTFEGLKRVKTKYVIKHRSDERYSNLIPFMENIRNNPHRMTSVNVYFRRCKSHTSCVEDCAFPDMHYVDYHMSDHLFGGRTDLLIKAFKIMDESYRDEELAKRIYFKTAETAFATCFLLAKGIEPDFNKVAEQMTDNFSVVPASKLGDTCIMNARKKISFDPADFENRGKVTWSIKYMDEINEDI